MSRSLIHNRLGPSLYRSLATNSTHERSGLSWKAKAAAGALSGKWEGTSVTGGTTKNFINGEFVESKASSDKWLEVHDPSTQVLLNRVPETTQSEFDQAVAAAETAFKTWSRTSILTRQRFALE